ncbi:MAG: DUF3034 family protein [Capsulimonadaceae bacterium]|nr:DUF3034 family protein [Capsulimonadaceae bacterium]
MRTRPKHTLAALLALGLTTLPFNLISPARAADAAGPVDTAQPLPFHSIEGYGGGAITPTAYLSNATPDKHGIGKPSFADSYVNLGAKSLTALTASETLFGRLELSFGADQFQFGTLPDAIRKATGVDIDKSSEWLYNYNARYLTVKESSNVPAVTIGVQFKKNADIDAINNSLGKALSTIGYKNSQGADYTLTASKFFANVGSHPLITTIGARESESANLGFLGFGNSYKLTAEGSLIYLPASNFVVAYEVRQKTNQYTNALSPLIQQEGTWQAIDVSYIVSPHSTLVAGYGNFGNLANTSADNAWWFQLKENL